MYKNKRSGKPVKTFESFIITITDNLRGMIAYWSADLNSLFANKPYMDWFENSQMKCLGSISGICSAKRKLNYMNYILKMSYVFALNDSSLDFIEWLVGQLHHQTDRCCRFYESNNEN